MSVTSIDALKKNLVESWDSITAEEVRASAGSAIKRFRGVVRAKGEYFEK